MKFLVWCGCVTVCLSGLEMSAYTHDGWRWLWIPLLVFYGIAGAAFGLLGLAKLVAGKVGAGGASLFPAGRGHSPAPHKEE